MIISYQPWLVPYVRSGRKLHTIRAWRKRPFREGDKLHFYTGPRMKPVKLGETVCTAVDAITIDERPFAGAYVPQIRMNGGWPLNAAERCGLAFHHGFDGVDPMMDWLKRAYGLPFSGQLIYWDPDAVIWENSA